MKELYAVRLDMLKIPTGENEKHALTMAESLLHICTVVKIWEEPKNGHRIFYVRSLPQDVPQAGIHWIEEEILYMPTMKGGETEA